MKRNLKTLFSFMLVAALLVAAFVCGTVNVAAEGELFSVGGVACADWGTAWSTALNGSDKIIKLEDDCNWSTTDFRLTSNVSFDLNGHELTVKTITMVSGSNLMDSSNGGGKVICTDDALVIQPNNSYLPVWVGDGYVLVQPNLSAAYQKFVAQDNGDYYFAFRPGFGKIDSTTSFANTYLKNNADHGLQMEFTLITDDDYAGEKTEKQYFYGADAFAQVYGENKMFFARFRGAENVEHLAVKTVLKSLKTGVEYTSEAVVGKAVMLDFSRTNTIADSMLDTLTVQSGHEFIEGVLNVPANSMATGYYDEFCALGTVYLDLDLSNLTTGAASEIRFYEANNTTNTTDLLLIHKNGPLYMGGTDNVGTLAGGAEAKLRIKITNSIVDGVRTSAWECYNKSTGSYYSGTFATPILGTRFVIFGTTAFNISNLKLYKDTNVDFNDLLQDLKISKTVAWTFDDMNNDDGLRPERITLIARNGGKEVSRVDVRAEQGSYTFNLPMFDANGEAAYTFEAVAEHYTCIPGDGENALVLSHTPAITYFYNNDFESHIFEGANPGWLGKNGYALDNNGRQLQDMLGYCWVRQEDGNNYFDIAGSGNVVYAQYASDTKPISGAVKFSFRVRLAEDFTLPDGTNLHFRTNGQWITAVMKDSSGNDVLACRTGNYPLSDEWLQVTIVVDGTTLTYQIGDNPSTSTAFAYAASGFDIRMNKNMGFSSGGVHIDDLKISAVYEEANVTGSIEWNDDYNAEGKRPAEMTLNVYNGSVLVDSAVVTEANNWQHSFTGLPAKDAAGNAYTYTVDVASEPEGYAKENDGTTVVFTYIPTAMDVPVNVVWVDDDDIEDLRPEKITISLNVAGEQLTKEVDAADGTYTFIDAPYATSYTLNVVGNVEGYDVDVEGNTITLSHTVTGNYFYNNDFEDHIFEGKNPGWLGKNGFALDNEGRQLQDLMGYCWVRQEEGNNYFDIGGVGKEVYVQHVSDTNPISGAVKISFRIRLAQDFTLPDNTNLHFRTNGQWITAVMKDNSGAAILACRDKNYSLSTEWLQVSIVVDGTTLTYQIGDNPETSVAFAYAASGFDIRMYGNASLSSGGVHIDNLRIINVPEIADVTGSIEWNDDYNAEGKRPAEMMLNLYDGSNLVDSAVVTEANNWQYTFADVIVKDAAGNAHTYTVDVASVPDGYTKENNGTTVTLTYVPTDMDVDVNLVWDDSNDNDGLRPEKITIGLNVAGEQITKEVDAVDGTYTFADAPYATTYTFNVVGDVAGYDVTVEGNTITLSHTPVISYFYNNDFEDHIFEGQNPGWLGKNGYALDNEGRQLQDLMGYCWVRQEDGNNYLDIGGAGRATYLQYVSDTNSISGAVRISFRVRLAKDFTLPDNMNLHFRTNGQWFTAVMKDNSGAAILACRDKNYPLSDEWLQVTVVMDGTTITYQIGDNPTTSKAFAYDVSGFDIRMSNNISLSNAGVHIDDLKISAVYEAVEPTANIVWNDGENADGIRPENVTLKLYNGANLLKTAVVNTDAHNYKHSFGSYPAKDAEGSAYNYRIEVEAELPNGYTPTSEGNTYTFTYLPKNINVNTSITWVSDEATTRPDFVAVQLLQNGVPYGEPAALNAAGNWAHTFASVPRADEDGAEYVYTFQLTALPTDYLQTNLQVGAFTLKYYPPTLYDHDFSNGTVTDNNGSALTMMNSYEVVNEDYLVVDGSNVGRLFYKEVHTAAYPLLDISFKIRLEDADKLPPAANTNPEKPEDLQHGVGLRTSNSTDSGRMIVISGDTLHVVEYVETGIEDEIHSVDSCQLSATEWVEVHLIVDLTNDTLYYQLVNEAQNVNVIGEIAYFDGGGRIELYAYSAGDFGLCIDDLKFTKGVTGETFS